MVFTGLGGQGLISLLKILGNALMKNGYEVITSETHGLSQRGGKVKCFLRFGNKLNAPIALIGSADLIIALEESTVNDVLKFAKPDKSTLLVVSTYEKPIIGIEYPSTEDILNNLYESSDNIYLIPAMEIAKKQTGNTKTMNIIMLGFIAKFLPLDKKNIKQSLIENFTGTILAQNLEAFNEGLNL
jgi:indolepyruvate ferredoxin oxidoreductase beta subunit